MVEKAHFTCPDCGARFRSFNFEWDTCGYCGYGYLPDEDYLIILQDAKDRIQYPHASVNDLPLIPLGKKQEDLLYYNSFSRMTDSERIRD